MESINTGNLPLEEKCVDRSWTTRLKSYEEATKLFRQIENKKSPEFHRFIGLIKSFVTDNHATAQEKGLEAALAYIENYTHAKNIAHDVMNGIVTKCIAARRARTKELALQITHKYVQLGRQEAVQEELLNGMHQKKNQAKTISACINAFTALLHKFGTETINVEPLMQRIGPLLSDRDKTVRDDTKLMIVELYKWIGRDALRRRLKKADIQAIQMNELEEEFERIESGKATLQQEEANRAKQTDRTTFTIHKVVGESTTAAVGVDSPKVSKTKEHCNEPPKETKKSKTAAHKNAEKRLSDEEIDEIITKLFTTNTINSIACSDWKARLQAAQQMLAVIQKSSNIPAQAVVMFLMRKPGLKETNIQVVKAKLAIIKHLAEHCKFTTTTADRCVAEVCERFIDGKNTNAVIDTLNAIAEATSLAEVAKTVIRSAFNQKSPKIQQESLVWLSGAVKEFGIDGLHLNFLIDASKQGISCSNGAVRQAAITLLGVVYCYVGNSLFGLIEGMKSSVLELIKAECEKYDGEEPPAPTRGVNKIEKPTEPDRPTVQIKVEEMVAIIEAPAIDDNENTSPLLKINGAKERRNSKWHVGRDSAKLLKREMIAAEVHETLIRNMFHSDPKYHLKAIELLTENFGNEALVYNLDLILKWLTLRLFDTDTAVMSAGLEFVRTVLTIFEVERYKLSSYEISVFVPYLIRKLDSPIRCEIREILQQMTRLNHKQMYVHLEEGVLSKNVIQRGECLDLLTCLFGRYDITILDECLVKIAHCMSDDDDKVQASALKCMTEAYNIVGDRIYQFLPENSNLLLTNGCFPQANTKSKKVAPKLSEDTSREDKISPLEESQTHTINQEGSELLKVKLPLSPKTEIRSIDRTPFEKRYKEILHKVVPEHSEQVKVNLTQQFPRTSNIPTFTKPDLSLCNLSSVDQESLIGIFEKLHSKERVKGVELLYDFLERCPGVDIKPFWDALSKPVREYVDYNLKDLQTWKALTRLIGNFKKQFEQRKAV